MSFCLGSCIRGKTWQFLHSQNIWKQTVHPQPLGNGTSRMLKRLFTSFVEKPNITVTKNVQQITRRLPLKLPPKSSRILLISLGSGCFGAVSLTRALSSHILCEYKPNNRVSTYEDLNDKTEVKLQWQDLLKLMLPDLWLLIGAIVSALAVAILNIQIPLVLGEVVNVLTNHTSDTHGDFVQEIKTPALKLLHLYSIQGLLTFAYISLLGSVGERVATRLRTQLFESIITQDIAFFDNHKTGEIVNRLTTDVQDFKSSFKLCVSQGLKSTTQVGGCIASLFLVSPKMTTVMVLVIPSIIGFGSLMGSGLRALSRSAQAQVSKATAVADEAIGNVRTVRAFAMEPKEIELYNKEVEAASSMNQSLGVWIGAFQGLSNMALNGIVLGTLYVGGLLMSRNELRAGDLMSFMVAVQTIQRSLSQLSLLFGQAVRGASAGARVFEYLQLRPSMPISGGEVIPYHSMRGDVEFTHVSFTYPTRPNQKVLKDFSLKIPGGRMVALVGLSGGGKSTVAGLLERLYDVSEGSITLDGRNIKDLDPSWLRGRAIGYINQEPVLFATSVMENIRYGRPDATDEEVKEAARQANAHTFISTFPEGYSTVLGERGVTVSGGQKQRIAIARALIKRPSILVLDEATSALDAESERVVQEALDNVVKGRTVLVIAHRLSTIRDADLIAVVANGVIAEMGQHEDLKRKKGIYWNLIKQQETEDNTANPSWFGQG